MKWIWKQTNESCAVKLKIKTTRIIRENKWNQNKLKEKENEMKVKLTSCNMQ